MSARCSPRASDRIYNPLPLYHSTGGVCAVGLAFLSRRRADPEAQILGAANSGSDIHKYDATMFDYIGELCRYLLNAPPGAA